VFPAAALRSLCGQCLAGLAAGFATEQAGEPAAGVGQQRPVDPGSGAQTMEAVDHVLPGPVANGLDPEAKLVAAQSGPPPFAGSERLKHPDRVADLVDAHARGLPHAPQYGARPFQRRALSGFPKTALAGHNLSGADEAFLLPRGQLGRTEFEHGIDIHVGYKKNLHAGVDAELFVDVFNLYNRQGTFRVDDTYAPQYSLSAGGSGGIEQNGTPISGGTYDDLIWAKSIDKNGSESSQPLGRNPNFGRTTSRYAPASAQVGFRVTF